MTISFEVRHAEIAPAHSATEAHDQHASESTLEAYTSLQSNGDGLYVSNSGVGWDQTDTSESGQEVWQATTESTEPFEIMSVYCAPCHTKEELGLYRADAGRARAKVVSMAEDYGCSSLTDEQVGVLSEFYTEEEGE